MTPPYFDLSELFLILNLEGRAHVWVRARTLHKPKVLVNFFKRIPVHLKSSDPNAELENFSLDRSRIATANNLY